MELCIMIILVLVVMTFSLFAGSSTTIPEFDKAVRKKFKKDAYNIWLNSSAYKQIKSVNNESSFDRIFVFNLYYKEEVLDKIYLHLDKKYDAKEVINSILKNAEESEWINLRLMLKKSYRRGEWSYFT